MTEGFQLARDPATKGLERVVAAPWSGFGVNTALAKVGISDWQEWALNWEKGLQESFQIGGDFEGTRKSAIFWAVSERGGA